MIQPPHRVNLSGLNHRETSQIASVLFDWGNELAGGSEGITCRGAVVVTQVLAGGSRSNEVLPHLSFPQKDTLVCLKRVSIRFRTGLLDAIMFSAKKITGAL
ncbi:hypothetical protein [Pantoea sp. BAV 3049]|uniref:hypothetical protein n=1 Tax=Pantoea sp. BAV 3049 TaxID=2654188 RepID=UPI00131CF840|nr:hypothetical protein [Pantoea sp. BAV 3049]